MWKHLLSICISISHIIKCFHYFGRYLYIVQCNTFDQSPIECHLGQNYDKSLYSLRGILCNVAGNTSLNILTTKVMLYFRSLQQADCGILCFSNTILVYSTFIQKFGFLKTLGFLRSICRLQMICSYDQAPRPSAQRKKLSRSWMSFGTTALLHTLVVTHFSLMHCSVALDNVLPLDLDVCSIIET